MSNIMKIIFGLILFFCFVTKARALECTSSQYLVQSHFRKAYVRSDGTHVSSSQVKAHCKELTRELIFLKDRFKNGIPQDWPHRKEISKKWTESEKQRIIEAVATFPEDIIRDSIEGLYRLNKSKDYPNPATSSDKVITIYDSAFDPNRNISRILAHEFLHHAYRDLAEKNRQDYRRATGWRLELEKDGKIYWVGRESGYVEEDGKLSHEEDFANNVEHFLYDSDKLRKVTPAAYEWIKKHYGEQFKLKEIKK